MIAFPSREMSSHGRQTTYDLTSGTKVAESMLPGALFSSDALSPRGSWVAIVPAPSLSGRYGMFGFMPPLPQSAEFIVQSFPKGDPKFKLPGTSQPSACTFNADESLLAVGFQNGSVGLWNLATSEVLLQSRICETAIIQLAFTGDGTTVGINDGKSPVRLSTRVACAMIYRRLVSIGSAD